MMMFTQEVRNGFEMIGRMATCELPSEHGGCRRFVIAAAKKKNDTIDARKIADCLRCDLLPECHMCSTEIRDRRRTLPRPDFLDTIRKRWL